MSPGRPCRKRSWRAARPISASWVTMTSPSMPDRNAEARWLASRDFTCGTIASASCMIAWFEQDNVHVIEERVASPCSAAGPGSAAGGALHTIDHSAQR